MIAAKRVRAPSVTAAGRKGAFALHAASSPEKRRERAITASMSAVLKRHGLPSTRELTRAYIARLRAEDPDLARFVELALKAPAKYAWNLAAILPPEEHTLAHQVYADTLAHLEIPQ